MPETETEKETTSETEEGQEQGNHGDENGTGEGQGKSEFIPKGENGLYLGKYKTHAEAVEGMKNLIETNEELKTELDEERTLREKLARKLQGEEEEEAAPETTSEGVGSVPRVEDVLNPAELAEYKRFWNAKQYDQANVLLTDRMYKKNSRPITAQLADLDQTTREQLAASAVDKLKAQAEKFPHFEALMPKMQEIIDARKKRDPEYGRAFSNFEEMLEAVYAEAERKSPDLKQPGKRASAAATAGGASPGSRTDMGTTKPNPNPKAVDPKKFRRLGLEVNPDQNRLSPWDQKLLAERQRQRAEEEAEARR